MLTKCLILLLFACVRWIHLEICTHATHAKACCLILSSPSSDSKPGQSHRRPQTPPLARLLLRSATLNLSSSSSTTLTNTLLTVSSSSARCLLTEADMAQIFITTLAISTRSITTMASSRRPPIPVSSRVTWPCSQTPTSRTWTIPSQH